MHLLLFVFAVTQGEWESQTSPEWQLDCGAFSW